jgi:hypothetical protein
LKEQAVELSALKEQRENATEQMAQLEMQHAAELSAMRRQLLVCIARLVTLPRTRIAPDSPVATRAAQEAKEAPTQRSQGTGGEELIRVQDRAEWLQTVNDELEAELQEVGNTV